MLRLSAPSTPEVAPNAFALLPNVSFDSESSSGIQTKSIDIANALETSTLKSSSMSLVAMFLQLLVIYSKLRYRKHNLLKLYQGMLKIFKFYHINRSNHINRSSCVELVLSFTT